MSQLRIIIFIFTFFISSIMAAHNGIDKRLLVKTKKYLLPDHHHMKASLDAIFSQHNVASSRQTMEDAGFITIQGRDESKIYVAKHPRLEGYVVKMFLDSHNKKKNRTLLQVLVDRAHGARLIQSEIKARNVSHIFKVPKKWIYPLPKNASPSTMPDKHFLLLAEDVHLLGHHENLQHWYDLSDPLVLGHLYHIIRACGLKDSVVYNNIPFCEDGKIAFVDISLINSCNINYERLNGSLNPEMLAHWMNITHQQPIESLSDE